MSIFTLEMGYEDILETPDDYMGFVLKDLSNSEIFIGKPQMTGLKSDTFESSNKFDEKGNPVIEKVNKVQLRIVNDEKAEYLDININLKKPTLKIDKVKKGSVLFDFIQSTLELETEGCTLGKNIFTNVNLQEFIDFIKSLQVLGVKNIERRGKFNFNSFYVVKANDKENKKLMG